MEQLDELATFAAVIETGGISQAAARLGVPKSTVSRRLARLEASLGARLVQRTTRQVRATDEGKALFDRVAGPLATLADATRRVTENRDDMTGRVRLTAPVDIGQLVLAPVIAEFCRRYPDIEVDVELTGRIVNLVEEGFDLAVRAGRLKESSLVARRITTECFLLAASPGYAAAAGLPQGPLELPRYRTVRMRVFHSVSTWRLTDGEREVDVEVTGTVVGNDFSFLRQCVVEGVGIGLLPRSLIVRDLDKGALVRVLPAWRLAVEGAALHLVYPSARQLPGRVRALRDFLLENLPTAFG
jgi:DNA-binding transcriptional LysR family regulator